jgi:hypothetical protein
MKKLLSYFILSISMVIFSYYYEHNSILNELIINTLMILAFIGYAEYKDKLITIFLKKE